jgi:hypothetical protein
VHVFSEEAKIICKLVYCWQSSKKFVVKVESQEFGEFDKVGGRDVAYLNTNGLQNINSYVLS